MIGNLRPVGNKNDNLSAQPVWCSGIGGWHDLYDRIEAVHPSGIRFFGSRPCGPAAGPALCRRGRSSVRTARGTLASPPELLDATLSPEVSALMQTAVNALQRCQPFTELPADKYKKWKTLDLVVTPLALSGG